MADRDFDLRILKAGSHYLADMRSDGEGTTTRRLPAPRMHYLADVRSPDGEEANRAFELPISP